MFLKVLFVFSFILFVNASDCDKSKCPTISKVYKELNCKPITEEGHCCPTRVECRDFDKLDDDKCYLDGRTYTPGESVDHDKYKAGCSIACRCSQFGSKADFTCAHIDCPEFFGFGKLGKNCIRQYDIDSCCSKNTVCDDELNKLAECHFEGKTYREGQKMYPAQESCHVCLCGKDFDNSTIIGNSQCQEINCGVELRELRSIQKGCIPVYYGDNKCCPIEFNCPNDNDEKIENEARSDVPTDENHTCKFGKLTLKVGDTIVPHSKNDCQECKCVMPPYAECIQKSNC